jgi:nucleoside-diphosphate-sugar epimerase
VLLPAMIFGAPEDRNIGRLLRFFARIPAWLPVPVPLPDGGRHTVQPVHVDDVAAAVAAAVDRPNAGREPIVVAGPAPITYGEMVRACARALGRRAVILPVPVGLLTAFAAALAAVGLRAPFSPAELRRAAESKAFDVTRLHDELGIVPRGFAAGLAQKVAERAF